MPGSRIFRRGAAAQGGGAQRLSPFPEFASPLFLCTQLYAPLCLLPPEGRAAGRKC